MRSLRTVQYGLGWYIRCISRTSLCSLSNIQLIYRFMGPESTVCHPNSTRHIHTSYLSTVNGTQSGMTEIPVTKAELSTLLSAHNTDRYYIEYKHGLVNHMSHGMIALHRLGANHRRLETFIEHYRRRLEDASDNTRSQEEEGVTALLGMHRGYYKLLGHYQGLFEGKYGGCMEEMVRGEFPALSLGMAGSAIHGLIHTGYGVAASHPRVVCEGLAYLHYSYCPMSLSDRAPELTSWGQGSLDVLDVLSKVREDVRFGEHILQESSADQIPKTWNGTFPGKVFALFSGKSDDISRYVHQIKFPEFYQPLSESNEQIKALMKWMTDCIIVVYQLAERRNDFFLLHGVTSSWALSRILPLIPNYNVALGILRTQFCILVTAYVAQFSPALVPKRLTEPDVSDLSWQELRSRVLQMPSDTDEHVIKLVQVCDDMSKVNTDARMSDVYKRAALTAMTFPLIFY